ncbi:uncharacterized protein LOC134824217 [Bolinopsis microptera]|uniref:uncharacterized protein LOC134824217 n=1 Tax=Bolinopsis microptera TaxID=2820187 RepID=UPI0030791F36
MEQTKFRNTSRECLPEPEVRPPIVTENSCMTKVDSTKDLPLKITCQTAGESLNISVLVIPEIAPKSRYNTTVSADDSPFWCLSELTSSDISAGHLLSLTYTGMRDEKERTQFYTVTLLPTWEFTLGRQFSCNNTNYTLNRVYTCLQFVPTGWPSFTNCTTLHKVGITIFVVLAFLTAYCVMCVGLTNLLQLCRRKKV